MLEKEEFCKYLKVIEEFNEKIKKGVKFFSNFIKNPNHDPFSEFQYELTDSFKEVIAKSINKKKYKEILEDIAYYYESEFYRKSEVFAKEYPTCIIVDGVTYELKSLEDLYDYIIKFYDRKN